MLLPQIISGKTRHSPNAGSMLTHRLRGWPNIEPTLGERLVIVWLEVEAQPSKHKTFAQCWFNAGPALRTVDEQ